MGKEDYPKKRETIAETLQGMGYATCKIGKTHFNKGPKTFPPTLHGFEESLGFWGNWDYLRLSEKDVQAYQKREGFPGRFGHQVVGPLTRANGLGTTKEEAETVSYENTLITDIFSDEAVSYIQKQEGERPFYLHISHSAVHMPTYVVGKKWAEKVGARYVPWDREAEKWGYPYWEPNEEHSDVFHQRWGHMGEIDPHGRRCYLSHLLALDDGVARLLSALEENGMRENTLVVFVSDNGGTINTYPDNTPLRGYKYMYGEGGIRVPFLVSMPGTLPEGRHDTEALVSAMDIFPTILDLANAPIPSDLDGKSLVPVLKGEKKTQHEWLAWASTRTNWAIRKGKWKLAQNCGWKHVDFTIDENGDCQPTDTPVEYPDGLQLFNLEEDISEKTNLAETHPEVVKELQALQSTWSEQMADPIKSAVKYSKK